MAVDQKRLFIARDDRYLVSELVVSMRTFGSSDVYQCESFNMSLTGLLLYMRDYYFPFQVKTIVEAVLSSKDGELLNGVKFVGKIARILNYEQGAALNVQNYSKNVHFFAVKVIDIEQTDYQLWSDYLTGLAATDEPLEESA